MVAKLTPSTSIQRMFNYNENKVKEGVAECIGVGNYPADHDQMSVTMKQNRLLKQIQTTSREGINSLHISLNFDVSETHLSKEKLMQIAEKYMQDIGFGHQPYIVYQHFDAAHPHIHLVTTTIQPDGKRISLNRLATRKSEPSRKAIEKEFGLVKAEEKKQQQPYALQPVSPSKAAYGKTETRRAITTVLEHVLAKYKFTSLPELNAILKQYNVIADRGKEDSRTFQKNGLFYRILDAEGKPIGVPIKASNFYNSPTLKNLAKEYPKNEAKRLPHKTRIKTLIDSSLATKPRSLQELTQLLEKQGIHTDLRQNDAGQVYGITYVDHKTKCVFNGSALGKQYSAKAIQIRCSTLKHTTETTPKRSKKESIKWPPLKKSTAGLNFPVSHRSTSSSPDPGNLFSTLMETEKEPSYQNDYAFKRKKRRRKKRRTQSSNS